MKLSLSFRVIWIWKRRPGIYISALTSHWMWDKPRKEEKLVPGNSLQWRESSRERLSGKSLAVKGPGRGMKFLVPDRAS